MIRSVTRWDWGPAAVVTLLILAAISVGGGAWIALVWVSTTYDFAALAHTLCLLLVLADLAVMARIGRRLYQAYRRQP